MLRRPRLPLRTAAAVMTVLALAGCAPPASVPVAAPEGSPSSTAPLAELLDSLVVQGRGPRTGYERELFGQAWYDADRNGCDTRNDVLRRDLRELEVDARTGGCVARSGLLDDPYTGAVIAFERGDGQVEVDHVVSLSDAWQKGAAQWPEARRLAFANDPLNLLPVAAAANSAKSDSDAATWLPPDRDGWCPMAARQVAVKAKYALSVTAAERDALARVLQGCPDLATPTSTAPTEAPLPRS